MFRHLESVSTQETRELKDGYVWFDWFSIPQITVGGALFDTRMRVDLPPISNILGPLSDFWRRLIEIGSSGSERWR